MARANFDGGISGTSEKLMSLSSSSSSRLKSVRDLREVRLAFILSCLSYRNYSEGAMLFSVGHRHNPFSEQSKGNETLFPIIKAFVRDSDRNPAKNLICIPKINTMLLQIRTPLFLIPLELHSCIVAPLCNYVNWLVALGVTIPGTRHNFRGTMTASKLPPRIPGVARNIAKAHIDCLLFQKFRSGTATSQSCRSRNASRSLA